MTSCFCPSFCIRSIGLAYLLFVSHTQPQQGGIWFKIMSPFTNPGFFVENIIELWIFNQSKVRWLKCPSFVISTESFSGYDTIPCSDALQTKLSEYFLRTTFILATSSCCLSPSVVGSELGPSRRYFESIKCLHHEFHLQKFKANILVLLLLKWHQTAGAFVATIGTKK